MTIESLNPQEQNQILAEINIERLNKLLEKLPTKVLEYLPENKVEMISNYANPSGVRFESLPLVLQELFITALENRFNNDPIQVFSYFPKCRSRCEGCRYSIETLRELEGKPESSSESYIDNQILFAGSIAETMKGNKSINNWYEGGGTATLQTVAELRKKWSTIKEIFGIEKNGSLTIEGNPTDFCKSVYVEELVENVKEIFGDGWEIRFSMGGFGFDITGRTEPEGSLIKAIQTINSVSKKLQTKININVDAVYGSTDSNTEDHLERIQKVLDLGIRNITLYGWEKSPNQKQLQSYIQEYFSIKEYIGKFAKENNLEIQSSPSSVGGDWINLAAQNELKNIEYLDGRWNKAQDLIAFTGYSLLEVYIGGKSYFIRTTTPQLTSDVSKLASSIKSEQKELGFTKEGLNGFQKIEVYNSNLKALNQLHFSGKLYKNLLTGNDMQMVWNLLKIQSFIFGSDQNGEYIDLRDLENKLVLDCIMKILSENFSPLAASNIS